ncbi:hypothetical protein BJ684DRAFT_15927 [Piptocephalis cylindrospora]|uniref:Uncharacterized protein n=1 Tax=Piptocephalis cylindrospora TaxID=1907219 RepID=A0A4P9Y444_9FUNG|nr:hypothetical protein BJ684DRAFT_15927 [Piptocephalis cylindrospora]|eukprot:RKP13697.1 hypothetical protein BJ684DRAFT_15927 [Piptocephalis cylindrospora]
MILPTPAASDINVDQVGDSGPPLTSVQGEGTAVPDSNRPFPPLPSMETIHRIVLAARSIGTAFTGAPDPFRGSPRSRWSPVQANRISPIDGIPTLYPDLRILGQPMRYQGDRRDPEPSQEVQTHSGSSNYSRGETEGVDPQDSQVSEQAVQVGFNHDTPSSQQVPQDDYIAHPVSHAQEGEALPPKEPSLSPKRPLSPLPKDSPVLSKGKEPEKLIKRESSVERQEDRLREERILEIQRLMGLAPGEIAKRLESSPAPVLPPLPDYQPTYSPLLVGTNSDRRGGEGSGADTVGEVDPRAQEFFTGFLRSATRKDDHDTGSESDMNGQRLSGPSSIPHERYASGPEVDRIEDQRQGPSARHSVDPAQADAAPMDLLARLREGSAPAAAGSLSHPILSPNASQIRPPHPFPSPHSLPPPPPGAQPQQPPLQHQGQVQAPYPHGPLPPPPPPPPYYSSHPGHPGQVYPSQGLHPSMYGPYGSQRPLPGTNSGVGEEGMIRGPGSFSSDSGYIPPSTALPPHGPTRMGQATGHGPSYPPHPHPSMGPGPFPGAPSRPRHHPSGSAYPGEESHPSSEGLDASKRRPMLGEGPGETRMMDREARSSLPPPSYPLPPHQHLLGGQHPGYVGPPPHPSLSPPSQGYPLPGPPSYGLPGPPVHSLPGPPSGPHPRMGHPGLRGPDASLMGVLRGESRGMVDGAALRVSPGPPSLAPHPPSSASPSPLPEDQSEPPPSHPSSSPSSMSRQSLFQQALPPPLPPQAPSITERVLDGGIEDIGVTGENGRSTEQMIRQFMAPPGPETEREQGDGQDDASRTPQAPESSKVILPVSEEFLARVDGTLPGPPPPLLESIGMAAEIEQTKGKVDDGIEDFTRMSEAAHSEEEGEKRKEDQGDVNTQMDNREKMIEAQGSSAEKFIVKTNGENTKDTPKSEEIIEKAEGELDQDEEEKGRKKKGGGVDIQGPGTSKKARKRAAARAAKAAAAAASKTNMGENEYEEDKKKGKGEVGAERTVQDNGKVSSSKEEITIQFPYHITLSASPSSSSNLDLRGAANAAAAAGNGGGGSSVGTSMLGGYTPMTSRVTRHFAKKEGLSSATFLAANTRPYPITFSYDSRQGGTGLTGVEGESSSLTLAPASLPTFPRCAPGTMLASSSNFSFVPKTHIIQGDEEWPQEEEEEVLMVKGDGGFTENDEDALPQGMPGIPSTTTFDFTVDFKTLGTAPEFSRDAQSFLSARVKEVQEDPLAMQFSGSYGPGGGSDGIEGPGIEGRGWTGTTQVSGNGGHRLFHQHHQQMKAFRTALAEQLGLMPGESEALGSVGIGGRIEEGEEEEGTENGLAVEDEEQEDGIVMEEEITSLGMEAKALEGFVMRASNDHTPRRRMPSTSVKVTEMVGPEEEEMGEDEDEVDLEELAATIGQAGLEDWLVAAATGRDLSWARDIPSSIGDEEEEEEEGDGEEERVEDRAMRMQARLDRLYKYSFGVDNGSPSTHLNSDARIIKALGMRDLGMRNGDIVRREDDLNECTADEVEEGEEEEEAFLQRLLLAAAASAGSEEGEEDEAGSMVSSSPDHQSDTSGSSGGSDERILALEKEFAQAREAEKRLEVHLAKIIQRNSRYPLLAIPF